MIIIFTSILFTVSVKKNTNNHLEKTFTSSSTQKIITTKHRKKNHSIFSKLPLEYPTSHFQYAHRNKNIFRPNTRVNNRRAE